MSHCNIGRDSCILLCGGQSRGLPGGVPSLVAGVPTPGPARARAARCCISANGVTSTYARLMRRPLGNMEAALHLTGRFAPMSVAGVVRLRGAPEVEKVRDALDSLQRIHPLLRARILIEKRRPWFDVSPEVPSIPLEVLRGGTPHSGGTSSPRASTAISISTTGRCSPVPTCAVHQMPRANLYLRMTTRSWTGFPAGGSVTSY